MTERQPFSDAPDSTSGLEGRYPRAPPNTGFFPLVNVQHARDTALVGSLKVVLVSALIWLLIGVASAEADSGSITNVQDVGDGRLQATGLDPGFALTLA